MAKYFVVFFGIQFVQNFIVRIRQVDYYPVKSLCVTTRKINRVPERVFVSDFKFLTLQSSLVQLLDRQKVLSDLDDCRINIDQDNFLDVRKL